MHIATLLAGFSAADITEAATRHRRPAIDPADRDEVYARPESTHCRYCTTPLYQRANRVAGQLHDGWRTLDHVIPLAHGGANDATNLVAACCGCNKAKGDLDLAEFLASTYLAMRRRTVARRAARATTRTCAA